MTIDITAHPNLPTEIIAPPLAPIGIFADPIEPASADSEARAPTHIENSTDATRGEPLGIRAQKRKSELEHALDQLPAAEVRARGDIELALSTVAGLLTGDLEHLSESTAADLSRWLESAKHLAEMAPTAPGPVADDGAS